MNNIVINRAPETRFFTIYSNDGGTALKTYSYYGDIIVTKNGFVDDSTNGKYLQYTYSGNKTFIGCSTQKNAIVPEYEIGDVIPVNVYDVYIVEKDPNPVNIDVKKLFGYSQLEKGTAYPISIKARAAGYEDSDASTSVSYVVPNN